MNLIPAFTKCPKCEAKYIYTEINSDNASGAEFWSDGFCTTSVRKDVLKFAKCPSCNTFFWLRENSIPNTSELSDLKKLENYFDIDAISNREINHIKEAFRSGLANNTESEITLRIALWHTINHIIRKYSEQGFFKKIKQKLFETAEYKNTYKHYNAISSLKMNNLIRLSNLLKLDKNENVDYLLFAEIYRELGDFSKAMIFCYKAETSSKTNSSRIGLLKQNITNKIKTVYKL
jgi:hypothetical protein